ncbi:hypothetical protein Tco_0323129 [Tanacetum coccineum]
MYWEFGKFASWDGESLKSYYSRFYKMMNELVRNKCQVTNHRVNIQFLIQLQPKWQRFVTLVKQSQELKSVSYHKLYDILKQHQNKANEIRAERLARTANPLALVAQQQPDYHSQTHPTHYTQNSSTRSQQAVTKNKDDALLKEKEIDKLRALISLSFKKIYKPTNNNLRTSSNTNRANQDNTPRINRGTGCKEFGHVARECQKLKWAKDAAYHKENMLLCKQEEAGIQLSAKQVDWRDDTDDEPEDQELEAQYKMMIDVADNSGPIFDAELLQKLQDDDNYNVFANDRQHHKQPEFVNDTYPDEQGDNNIIIDSLDMSNNGAQAEHDNDDLAKERNLLASLIEKLKCEIDDSKNRNKFLELSNQTLVDKLKSEIECFKNKNKCLESSNNHFKEANTKLANNNQLMFKDLKKFQAELDRYHDVNYASKVEIECAKAKGELVSHKMSSEKPFNEYTRKINDLNQMILEMKKELIADQESISIMLHEKEAQNKFYKTCKEKKFEKVIALENKIKVLDDIVYKIDQSVQTMNMLNRCYNDNIALMLAPDSDKTIRLAQENQQIRRIYQLDTMYRPFHSEQRIDLQSKQRAAGKWFKKDCIGSVNTWDDLVEKFVQKFYQLSDHNEEIEDNDDPDDITDIFKIEGNLFDFKTPLCEAFNDFNYLFKIDKNGVTKWPTCSSDIDVFCNGGELPGMVRVGSMTYFQDHKWYDELADGILKNETLMHKAKVEKSWGNATPGVMKLCSWLINSFRNFHELDYNVLKSYANIKNEKAHDLYLEINNIFGRDYDTSNTGTQDNQGHEERRDDPTFEPSVCKIRRFKMMKYSFNADEEYIAIKELEYLNHSKHNLDAYRELLRIIDEGWVVATPDEE